MDVLICGCACALLSEAMGLPLSVFCTVCVCVY